MATSADRLRFIIEYIFDGRQPVHLTARWLGTGDFRLTPSSTLGGVPLRLYLDQPRAIDSSGAVRLDLFTFALKDGVASHGLKVGDEVELVE